MINKRVFIGWNGADNREIARMVSNMLSDRGYLSIVGGEWRASLTVSEEIIHQMNGCDYAIILIEKEERLSENGVVLSRGFNPNVMMELGYMLRKVIDHNRIRRILINMDPSELPSDLQGAWTVAVEKHPYDVSDEEARTKVLSEVACEVAEDFFQYMSTSQNTNKLDYFDNWEENVLDIYHYTGDVRIADKLIYGMQAAIYSGDFDRLYKQLGTVKDKLSKKDTFGDYKPVACAMAILNVFVTTRRLTKSLTEEEFALMFDALNHEYEKDIKDSELSVWCKIFRKDKLELCYENFAQGQENEAEKREYYIEALKLCHEVSEMIEEQVQKDDNSTIKKDEGYSLIYQAFANRNISQIHMHLAKLEHEKADEHLNAQKEYCKKTLEYRKRLYDYYKGSARETSLSMDFISQEYLLALAEQFKFEESIVERKKIEFTAKNIFNKWQDRNKIRNMIFEKVREEAKNFLN